MLTITVGSEEYYDEEDEEFVTRGGTVLQLEHSLVSLSKWEAIHEKPFLQETEKTSDETLSYIKCMILGPEVSPEVFAKLDNDALARINDYIGSKQTATWFAEEMQGPKSREVITNELIYYWLNAFEIPWEAQYWHLNRLFTLIRVHNVKTQKPKRVDPQKAAADRARLNAERQAKYNTTG